jgi:flagellar protein FliO/FliZ
MFESLFGTEMPLVVRFFLAFLIVLGLIGATAWAVRRFGAGGLRASPRGRQPRLAVIDFASIDARRRLILVRRDNVEHLLIIGGPTDVVIESNIVRAVAPPRDLAAPRATTADTLGRAIALPENGNGSWPLQPEPAGSVRPGTRLESLPEEPATWPLQPNAETPTTPARAQRDTLTALADEITARAVPPRARTTPAPRPSAAEARSEPRGESRPVVSSAAPAAPATEPLPSPDQSLAEMAHRLEAALRKPSVKKETGDGYGPAVIPPSPATPGETATPAETTASPAPSATTTQGAPQRTQPKMPRAESKQSSQSKSVYDNLEQEMASLLGRPPSKS